MLVFDNAEHLAAYLGVPVYHDAGTHETMAAHVRVGVDDRSGGERVPLIGGAEIGFELGFPDTLTDDVIGPDAYRTGMLFWKGMPEIRNDPRFVRLCGFA